MRSIGIALAALIGTQPAIAGEWTQFNVSSTRSGQNGTAAKISGVIDDSHGARPARLVVSCVDNGTSVFMSADFLVFGGDIVRAEYTIDGGSVHRAYWNVCAGDLCTGLWNGAGIPFVKSFLDAAVLKMTLTRHFGEPIHATFPVYGAREALKEIGRQCGWMPKD
jgi:Type VI secretion system VasI, EvfG, VC_A0118